MKPNPVADRRPVGKAGTLTTLLAGAVMTAMLAQIGPAGATTCESLDAAYTAVSGAPDCAPPETVAAADTASLAERMDGLFFPLNEAEQDFADGGPAFVSPAPAVAGLATPDIRRAFLRRELEKAEGDVRALEVRKASRRDDRKVARELDAAKSWVASLRRIVGGSQTPSYPTASKPSANLSGTAGSGVLRFHMTPGTASSLAYREVDRDGMRGRIVTGTRSLEYRPTANLTTGAFGRVRYAEGRANDLSDSQTSVGYSLGFHNSLDLTRDATLSGAILYGRSENVSKADGVKGEFSGDRLIADGRIDRSLWSGNWSFTPSLSAHYEEAGWDAFTDSLGARVTADRHISSHVSIGSEISRSFLSSNEGGLATIHPFVNGRIGIDPLREDGTDEAGSGLFNAEHVTAALAGGIQAFWGTESSLRLTGEYSASYDENDMRLSGEFSMPFGSDRAGPRNTLSLAGTADLTGTASASLRAVVPLR